MLDDVSGKYLDEQSIGKSVIVEGGFMNEKGKAHSFRKLKKLYTSSSYLDINSDKFWSLRLWSSV